MSYICYESEFAAILANCLAIDANETTHLELDVFMSTCLLFSLRRKGKDTVDICKLSYIEKTNANDMLLITSPDFPHDYPPSVDCTCVVQSNNQFSLDVLWFSLQDNDFLSIADKSLTDWVNPTHEYPIMDKSVKLRFQTDDSLAYNGFWLKVKESETCKSDWQLVGDNCIKVFGEALDWRSANSKCQALNGYLIKIDDVIGDLKLTQYMNKYCTGIFSWLSSACITYNNLA